MTRISSWFVLAGATSLAACSSTKVTLELTDAPPAESDIEHVYVSLNHVDVHVAGDAAKDEASDDGEDAGSAGADDGANEPGWRTVTPKAGTFDLVALRNDVRAALGELDLPDGKITQIRLFMDGAGRNEVLLASGEACPLDLSSVPPTGIKINHPFKALDVTDSSKLNLVVDFDLDESLSQTAACSFTLRPVIKLKHVEKD